MDNKKFKERFLEELYNHNFVKPTYSGIEYRTRCPYCGDSDDPTHVHFYLKVNLKNNSGIVGHCFKCDSGGPLDKEMIELLGIDSKDLLDGIEDFNKKADKADRKKLFAEDIQLFFDYKLPDSKFDNEKLKYIENRLGINFTYDDLNNMKAVSSLYEFLDINKIKLNKFDKVLLNTLDKYYVGFLSSGNSYMLLRNITDHTFKYAGHELSNWVKIPLNDESTLCKCFYSISTDVDILTNDTITVNISEGVFDIVSVFYNLGYSDSNTMNIAVTGKYYDQILLYLLSLGIVGSNVIVNIFADNDKDFNPTAKNPTTPEYFKKRFAKFKYLYGSVNLYYNIMNKDFGYPKDKIIIKKIKL